MKKILTLLLVLTLAGIIPAMAQEAPAVHIALSDDGVLVDGAPAPADQEAAVYTANDIVFYLAGQDFTYGEGTEADGHTQEEADAHTVVHITKPGTYVVSGSMSAGQIAVDIDGGKKDPEAVVTLVLSGVDLTCSVAPAVIFYNVYECGDDDAETASMEVDLTHAGANVVIADGTVNTLNGSYVARIYDPETVELSEDGTEVADAKKLHKYDGTLYSKRSMNLFGGPVGDGVLNIHAENEGLCSDLHLAIHGGNINITSGNDGINASEDNVSVAVINGGSVNISVNGATGEGDGIDSNGWLVINGGTVTSAGCGFSMDAGIDSDKGIYLNGGTLCASGNMFDHIAGGTAAHAVFSFDERQQGGAVYTLKDASGSAVAQWTPANDFTILVVSGEAIVPGEYTLWMDETQLGTSGGEVFGFGGRPPMGGFDPGSRPEPPKDFDPANMPEPPEGFDNMPKPPEGFGRGGMPRMGGGSRQPAGEREPVFTLTEKGGMFSGVGSL